jgi:hypothetical protein
MPVFFFSVFFLLVSGWADGAVVGTGLMSRHGGRDAGVVSEKRALRKRTWRYAAR